MTADNKSMNSNIQRWTPPKEQATARTATIDLKQHLADASAVLS